jgi:recombinational DNA repair ATPase RecF
VTDFYKITRLRLVNFHNIGTTTLDIRDGGHLFLLGDNGSGKTTVLDAIHFVLTGGRSMEFNSAARVAGSKAASGRNIQGVILRYNIETSGPMRPDGGIAYAALEIETRGGHPVSIAVGVSARSMEENYESWGAVADGPVADLPLVREEDGRRRPATRHELKDALGSRYYARIGAYTDALAERFFGGRQTYEDVCRLIATGKAYRELAAKAGDYDKLFRSLLQEPHRDVFEALIRNLKSIEESRLNLDALREKARFVRDLAAKRDDVQARRIDAACARWQERALAAAAYRTQLDTAAEFLAAENERLAGLKLHLETYRADEERAGLRLNELRQKDAQGLVTRERDARITLDKAKAERARAKTALVQAKRALAEADAETARRSAALAKRLQATAAELRRLGRALLFPTTELAGFLDDAARAAAPEDAVADMPAAGLHRQADAEADRLSRAREATEKRLDALAVEIAALENDLDAKRKQEEAVPRVAGFLEARRDIRETLLAARPLYEGLVPASGLRPRDVAMLEQLIGDDILATWLVTPDAADALRNLLFKRYPALALAVPDGDDDTRCDWLGRFFDIAQSDPDALLVLRQQLAARAGPRAEKFLDLSILHFRNRERPAILSTPRLIGLEARRDQLQREIRELEKTRNAKAGERKAAEQEAAELKQTQAVVTEVKALLQTAPSEIQKAANDLRSARHRQTLAQLGDENAARELNRCEEETDLAAERLGDIQLKLRAEGLEGLEDRIRDAERKRDAARKESDACTGDIKVAERNIKANTDKTVEWDAALAAVLGERDAAESQLLALVTPDAPVDAFAAARCGADAGSREALNRRREDARVAAAGVEADIANALRQDENAAFGFIYDPAANTLTDRRGAGIDAVTEETARQLADQESLITDETRRLFKQIVMDELIAALQSSVKQLREMTRRISRLLKDRAFGNNHYDFSISPADGFGAIIDIVQQYRAFAPEETETELKAFFDVHLDDILATEVGDIPCILDYRNWFRYELKIITANAGGQVIDRKVKGIGSGGEQAVPNYLLILMIANFLYDRDRIRLPVLIFDEAFYGIDANRRDQLLVFASDLNLQLFVASPDLDGVKKGVPHSTSVLVVKDAAFDVHLYPAHWDSTPRQQSLLDPQENAGAPPAFDRETP